VGIRASKPLEILHVDATLLSLKDNTQGIYLPGGRIISPEPYYPSDVLWNSRLSSPLKTCNTFLNPCLALPRFEHCNLITDEGTENYREASKFLHQMSRS